MLHAVAAKKESYSDHLKFSLNKLHPKGAALWKPGKNLFEKRFLHLQKLRMERDL
jgi:hypothetical protein